MVRVITINNFKGGVSKTSTTNGIAYILAEKWTKSFGNWFRPSSRCYRNFTFNL